MRIAFFGDSLTAGRPGAAYLTRLARSLPGHELLNYGRGNDTVRSLSRRLDRLPSAVHFDIAVLFVGVNDVDENPPPLSFWLARRLSRQLPARGLAEFRDAYARSLDRLLTLADEVIAVAPLLKGENLASAANRRVATLAAAVADLTADRERARYLDLRPLVIAKLAGTPVSDYLPRTSLGVVRDALQSPAGVERTSRARGLRLTLDGIHLNAAGAELVAAALAEAIAGAAESRAG